MVHFGDTQDIEHVMLLIHLLFSELLELCDTGSYLSVSYVSVTIIYVIINIWHQYEASCYDL
jgi:hypothetical protein